MFECPWCKTEIEYRLETCWDDYLNCPTCDRPIVVEVDGGCGYDTFMIVGVEKDE